LLFNDTFTNYCHPDIGVAAAETLAAADINVDLLPHGCCGRPMISQGLLDHARDAARRNVDALWPAAERGDAIVFVEPSCLSAVREDGPALLRGEDQRRARRVAEACMLFEEFVERRWTAGQLRLHLQRGPRRIVLHGHCHQKAMGLLAPARALLQRIPGCEVTARAMDRDAVLVAAGFSCRQQVADFAGVRAVHPAVLIRSLLAASANQA
jgi:Fe-S oxidoreductase